MSERNKAIKLIQEFAARYLRSSRSASPAKVRERVWQLRNYLPSKYYRELMRACDTV